MGDCFQHNKVFDRWQAKAQFAYTDNLAALNGFRLKRQCTQRNICGFIGSAL